MRESRAIAIGLVAEWLCSGLQIRVRRFNSDPGLQTSDTIWPAQAGLLLCADQRIRRAEQMAASPAMPLDGLYVTGVCFRPMQFVETPLFTRLVLELLSDEEYSCFQQFLMTNPGIGDVIQGTGGLRKIRWASGGKGKRGGVRVIYYCVDEAEQIRLLLIYKKGVQDDRTPDECKQLKAIKDRWQ